MHRRIPLLTTLAAVAALPAAAQVPKTLVYQGYLTDPMGGPVNGTKTLMFSLLDGSEEDATSLWNRDYSVTVEEGFFAVVLEGVGTGMTGMELEDVVRTEGELWIGVSIQKEDETFEAFGSPQPLGSVPWALVCEEAQNVAPGGVTFSDWGDTCTEGQIPKMRTTGWECADDGGGGATSWNDLTDVPPGFADDVDNEGDDWTSLSSVPPGFADDVDNEGVTSVVTGEGLTGGPIMDTGTVSLAADGVTSSHILDGTIQGTDISTTAMITAGSLTAGTVTAGSFMYSTPVEGVFYSDPTACQRADTGGDPHEAGRVMVRHPAALGGNPIGPGFRIHTDFENSQATRRFYCSVPVVIPPGATMTLTEATLSFYDVSEHCVVGAMVRHKPFATQGDGTSIGMLDSAGGIFDPTVFPPYPPEVFTPAGGLDTYTVPLSQEIDTTQIVWIEAVLAQDDQIMPKDCRYQGVQIRYTVSGP